MNLKTSLKMDDQLDPVIMPPLKTEKEKEAEKKENKILYNGYDLIRNPITEIPKLLDHYFQRSVQFH
jgi:hypothetical protein